ncbi:MAG: hypothetical protein RI519_06710 [Balneolaceae bacterium]|nr:hypothetical protein [Balneolaceae bacterium]
MRECLMDGPVAASLEQDLDLFYKDRVTFLSALTDTNISKESYTKEVGGLFGMIQYSIDHANLVLWFEHDLFCQANCWCILWLITKSSCDAVTVWMVHPKEEAPYSFAAHTTQELVQAFDHAQPVKEIDQLAQLWPAYCNQDNQGLVTLAHKLKSTYPFLMPAIQAHLDRHPTDESPGRPIQTLMQIKQSSPEASFGEIFQEFSRREGIYGMGDLQVKQLLQSEL